MANLGFWLADTVASAFVSSILKCSCIALPDGASESDSDSDSESFYTCRNPSTSTCPSRRRSIPTVGIPARGFHHVEFRCLDPLVASQHFKFGLGMKTVATSDRPRSHVIRSGKLTLVFTAAQERLSVKAVGIFVDDAGSAFRRTISGGAVAVSEPRVMADEATGGRMVTAEVKLYGNMVLRFVSNIDFYGPYLPNYQSFEVCGGSGSGLGLHHIVGINANNGNDNGDENNFWVSRHVFVGCNDWELELKALLKEVGHPAMELCKESGSEITCIAVMCEDIFRVVEEMASHLGGFVFDRPEDAYYEKKEKEVGEMVSEFVVGRCKEMGIRVDRDFEGIYFHILTKPLGHRDSICLQLIQHNCV